MKQYLKMIIVYLIFVLMFTFVGCAKDNIVENNNNGNETNNTVVDIEEELIIENNNEEEVEEVEEVRVVEAEVEKNLPQLSFNDEGTFKIVQLTDTHINGGGEKDQKTIKLIEDVLALEKPDMVILTGDMITTKNIKQSKIDLRSVVAPIIEAGIPYAAVLGNHDSESGIAPEELMNVLQESDLCYAERGDADINGVGNYYLEIKAHDSDEIKSVFYFLDSGVDNENTRIGGYDFIHRDQINWYVETSQMLQEKNEDYTGLMFFHIPIPEYNKIWDSAICFGEKNEEVKCPIQNSGMYSAMAEMGDINGVFVGHDHVNDYYGNLKGIILYYGRATGYNAYGDDVLSRGVRVIEINEENNKIASWIVEADGTVITKQELHSFRDE